MRSPKKRIPTSGARGKRPLEVTPGLLVPRYAPNGKRVEVRELSGAESFGRRLTGLPDIPDDREGMPKP